MFSSKLVVKGAPSLMIVPLRSRSMLMAFSRRRFPILGSKRTPAAFLETRKNSAKFGVNLDAGDQ